MLITLDTARKAVRRFVDSGTCDNTVVTARINEALQLLLDQQPWECLKKVMRINICGQCLTLPYECESVINVDIDGKPGRVYGPMYQFVPSGPGDLDFRRWGSGFKDMMDLGDNYPLMYDIPKVVPAAEGTPIEELEYYRGLPVAAFSTNAADAAGNTITVIGKNASNETLEETIPVQRWHGGVEGDLMGRWNKSLKLSTGYFTTIDRVIKPVTKGYVSFYAVDTPREYMYTLAKYHPDQDLPAFRRYKLTNTNISDYTQILVQVRMRYVPLVSDNDVLPIDSIAALKYMIMAQSRENALDAQGAATFMAAAIGAMAKREEAKTMTSGTPVIVSSDYRFSMGKKMNRGTCM